MPCSSSSKGEINAQSVLGAICIYVLLGLLFTFVYGAAAKLGSGAFFTQGTDGTVSLRLYFSYVTLATLGYGDYTPAGTIGHTLAITEALLGQLYLESPGIQTVVVSTLTPHLVVVGLVTTGVGLMMSRLGLSVRSLRLRQEPQRPARGRLRQQRVCPSCGA